MSKPVSVCPNAKEEYHVEKGEKIADFGLRIVAAAYVGGKTRVCYD
jgi:hypothetical protein